MVLSNVFQNIPWYSTTVEIIFHRLPRHSHDIPTTVAMFFLTEQLVFRPRPLKSQWAWFMNNLWRPMEIWFFSAYNKISTKITLNGEYILYHGLVYLTILYPIISFCILPHHLHLIISHGILVYHIVSYYITIISCLCILIFMCIYIYIYIYILLYCYILLSLMISCCSILYHIVSRPSSAMAWKGSYI